MPPRRLVVWCPDWPVVAAARAAELGSLVPTAVFAANRVVACSATARDGGVRRGMRRREAQSRCPDLVVCEHDPDRDARLFEPVVAAVEDMMPGVEIVRPGLVAVPARGPARYFGSEAGAAERVIDKIDAQVGVECQVGIADGLFAAVLAARRGQLVAPGLSPEFLAPLAVDEIDQLADRLTGRQVAQRAELVDLLRRLGIRTLGEFAALDPSDVATRFGRSALVMHRAAGGREERPVLRRQVPPDLVVSEELDPPVDRVDRAAFAAKVLADRLHARLGDLGLACTRLGISARTEHGEELERVWRCAEPLTPAATADRVRWQLDGWLNGRSGSQRPTAGVSVLSLRPEEVVGAGGLQLDLLSAATGEADARAGRAFARVQGMLGPEAVLTGVLDGGRDLRDQVRFVPWGDERRPALAPDHPWPGRIPSPSPSVVPDSPWPAVVLDVEGRPVEVTDRDRLTAAPSRVEVAGGRSRAVSGWAGPWPVTERWWAELLADGAGQTAPATQVPPRSLVRVQVVLEADSGTAEPGAPGAELEAGEVALLLVHEQGRWWVQGAYR
ncbi:DNA polymerase Y family protein [Saccharopolyspora sp. NPDC002686]|uniref:DNA polymerase Y family protein n=1 Tax=Saccharopolyspora sp. NPDC002686 TaxID=3154541 RepID=UPI003327EBC3